jgi:hypothetical protein
VVSLVDQTPTQAHLVDLELEAGMLLGTQGQAAKGSLAAQDLRLPGLLVEAVELERLELMARQLEGPLLGLEAMGALALRLQSLEHR